jgi:uncharacterized protein (TIGR02271 family)
LELKMSQILVGVFDSFEQAEQAVTRLTQGGIPRRDMEVHTNDSTQGNAERPVVDDVAPSHDAGNVGVFGKIEHFFSNMFGGDESRADVGHYQEAVRRGGALLTVNVADETHVTMVRSTLYEAGAVDIDERVAHWKNTGYAGYDAATPPYTPEQVASDRQAFSVVRESLDVGKREVETGGVRVYSRVTETPVTETVNLREEHATIERRPVDRVATAADLKGGSIEIRETAEHAVVGKTAHVVEEVVVGREATERTETINETLRGTHVEVEHTADGKAEPAPGSVTSTDVSPSEVEPRTPL